MMGSPTCRTGAMGGVTDTYAAILDDAIALLDEWDANSWAMMFPDTPTRRPQECVVSPKLIDLMRRRDALKHG